MTSATLVLFEHKKPIYYDDSEKGFDSWGAPHKATPDTQLKEMGIPASTDEYEKILNLFRSMDYRSAAMLPAAPKKERRQQGKYIQIKVAG
jgi:hypothetical protein